VLVTGNRRGGRHSFGWRRKKGSREKGGWEPGRGGEGTRGLLRVFHKSPFGRVERGIR